MEPDIEFDPAEVFAEVSEKLEGLELSGGWQIISITPNLTMKQRKDIDNEDIIASEVFIKSSPDAILQAIVDPAVRRKWDRYFGSFEVLENWGKNLQIVHHVQKYKWPMSDRDFILLQGIAKNPDEMITIGWKSVKYDNRDWGDAYVRGRVVFAGFVITRVDEGTSHVSYFEKSFPNVSVPEIFARKMQLKNVELPNMLKLYLMKE